MSHEPFFARDEASPTGDLFCRVHDPVAGASFWLPEIIGVHDVTWLDVRRDSELFPYGGTFGENGTVPVSFLRFLFVIEGSVDLSLYRVGTAYWKIIDAREPTPPGQFHYDSGVLNRERNVDRFVMAASSDDYPVSNVFSPSRDHQGRLVDEVSEEEYFQPPNRYVVQFSEGTSLHGRASAPARPGEWTVFCSATLYRPQQEVDLSCSALKSLR